MDVRRLAAIDMWGARGTLRRRRAILVEFALGFVAAVSFGAWMLTISSCAGSRLIGVWMVGTGLNYAPLAAYAMVLTRPGALDRELGGVDVQRELRRYGAPQLWIVVPFILLWFVARREFFGRRPPTG